MGLGVNHEWWALGGRALDGDRTVTYWQLCLDPLPATSKGSQPVSPFMMVQTMIMIIVQVEA